MGDISYALHLNWVFLCWRPRLLVRLLLPPLLWANAAATLRGGSHTASTLYKSHLFVFAIRDKLSIYTYATRCLALLPNKIFKKFGECSSWDRRKRIIHAGAHSPARTTCIYGFWTVSAVAQHTMSPIIMICALRWSWQWLACVA